MPRRLIGSAVNGVVSVHLVRSHRSAVFERRSALYARLDRLLFGQTRFFAAAALVNAVFARFFGILPAIRAPSSFQFLNMVGTALESDNLAYARSISRSLSGGVRDYDLVCAEQSRLQCYVHMYRAQDPQQWKGIRSELNSLLNNRYQASFLSRCSFGTRELVGALGEVRKRLGRQLDFQVEAHRISIGLKLIEHIRCEERS